MTCRLKKLTSKENQATILSVLGFQCYPVEILAKYGRAKKKKERKILFRKHPLTHPPKNDLIMSLSKIYDQTFIC